MGMSLPEFRFDTIRPYHDWEIPDALERLLQSPAFYRALLKSNAAVWMKRPQLTDEAALRDHLQEETRAITTVGAFQEVMIRYAQMFIEYTTREVKVQGLEHLVEPEKGFFFVSTHDDICFDPSLISTILHHHGFATPLLGYGDNLLIDEPLVRQMIEDLFRPNKGVLIKRKPTMAEAMELSEYLWHQRSNGNSVWTSQGPGRSKDGTYRTDPKWMGILSLYARRHEHNDFSEVVERMRFTPVIIKYEYLPCAVAKALEAGLKEENGNEYVKQKGEDTLNMGIGANDYKGEVAVIFGHPLQGDFPDARHVAAAVDAQNRKQYPLHRTNQLAAKALTALDLDILQEDPLLYGQAMQCHPAYRTQFLRLYANPALVQKQEMAVQE